MLFVAVISSFVGCSGSHADPDETFDKNWNNYFPLRPGNSWQFENEFDHSERVELRIPGYIFVRNRKYALLEMSRFLGNRLYQHLLFCVTYDKDGIIRFYWPSDRLMEASDFNSAYYITKADSGTTWGWGDKWFGRRISVVSRGMTVHTAAGSFNGCIGFGIEESIEFQIVDYLAAEIGPVKWYGCSLVRYEVR